jgi:molecular chaperone GrpE
MAPDENDKLYRIPVSVMDPENESDSSDSKPADMDIVEPDNESAAFAQELDGHPTTDEEDLDGEEPEMEELAGGPDTAELIATRSELRRVEAENADLKDRLARRQADFENYRKRIDRERSETYNRVVADVATKLLPVLDNLKRAFDAEASVQATESDEFRHFLSGVDLIYKQLNGVLEALGVKPIVSVGEHFNPHIHEAVATEATDEYDPETVIQEIVAGYRLGDKLIRPAMVKVSTRNEPREDN